jgi:rhamnosyl/mannosyltransferase
MKVLHVYRTYFPDPPGGLQEAIRQISMATQSLGVDPSIFALSPAASPSTLAIDGIDVIRSHSWAELQSCNIGGWAAIQTFRQLAQTTDIIHYHFPWPFADLLNLFAPREKPKVMTYHSDIVRQRWLGAAYRPVLRSMLNSMDRIVATSDNYQRTSTVLQDKAWRDRVCVIPLGIKDQAYQHSAKKTQSTPSGNGQHILKRLGLKDEKSADNKAPYFLFIGALRYYKGLIHLIHAARHVKAKVVVVGTGPDLEALAQQTQRDGHNTNVIFAGLVSDADKFALLRDCLALVLPSHRRSEAFGMTLVEASMFAKPMISCDIGTGTSYVNVHGKTGLVVPPESPQALAHAMNSLLDNESLRHDLGLAARERYELRFTSAALGRAYFSLYQGVLNDHL